MNDFDFDELIGGLKTDSADDSFREELLLKSQRTLVRSRVVRHAIRATGVFSCVLLLVAGAFVCGRFSGDGSGGDATVANAGERVSVSTELVDWLDAGRFFERIGMQDRAVRAYKNASKLIPAESVDQQAIVAGQGTQLASLLRRAETAAMGKIDNEKIQGPEWTNCALGTILVKQ